MEVKVYREKENEGLILDEDQLKEYKSLVDSLGLENKVEEKQTPNVYTYLNSSMKTLLKAICPSIVKIEKYSKSTIPLEVLKIVEYAKSQNMFDHYKIWYADKDPDPLLIGCKYHSDSDKANGYDWNTDDYLMARWGDEALEIPELLKRGFESMKISFLDSANEVLNATQSAIDNPDAAVRRFLKSGDNLPRFDFSGSSSIGNLPF